MKRSSMFALCILAMLVTTPLVRAEDPAGYKVLKKITIGGDGRWDYLTVDPINHHLFVPRSTHVQVLDLSDDNLKVVGDIPDTAGVHGVAIAPDAGRGFTSNGKANTVTIFDLKTFAVIGTVKTGDGPDSITFDPASGMVFAMCHKGGTVTAFDARIDPAKTDDVKSIEVGGTLETGITDGAGHLFVNVEDKSEIVQIDTKALTVLAHWPIAPGEEPSGLAIDAKKNLLFAGCGNEKMAVIDATSGKIIDTLPIGKGVDACAFDADANLAFASNGDSTLTVINDADPAHPAVVGNVATQKGARTIALDTGTHRLYLPTAEFEPPAPDAEPKARPKMKEGTFAIIVVGKE